jgi:hypothetical protein
MISPQDEKRVLDMVPKGIYIDGKWKDASDGKTLDVIDPATGKVAGTVVMQPGGLVTFTPAPGFTGQAPTILYTVESSDGQVSPGTLTVTLAPSTSLPPAAP